MTLALGLGLAGFLFGCFRWRQGILLCIAVGFLQDPLRKVTPGQPVAFVVLVGFCFFGCAVGFLLERGTAGFSRFFAWHPRLRAPIVAFIVIVMLQAVRTISLTGSPIIAGVGLLSYLSPLVALFLGMQFFTTARDVGRWQRLYLVGALVVSGTILLDFAGLDSRLFSSIGVDTVYGRGGRIEMVSGLMRSSEIAAWHAATASCLVMVWAVARRRTRAFWFGAATTIGLLLSVVLTGRRKTLGEALLFLLVFALLLGRSRAGASRLYKAASVLAFGGLAVFLWLSQGQTHERWSPYFERSYSVFADAPERLRSMTIDQFEWVLHQNGLLGSGAGTGAQGAQYFGGGVDIVGGSAEGGLGRVLAELGVPGLVIILWLSVAVGLRLLRIAHLASKAPPGLTVRFLGLIALLPANAVVFLTAHQIFGDPFVLIVLGLTASSALAFPQIYLAESQAAPPSIARVRVAPPSRRAQPA